VILPQKPAGTLLVAVQGAEPPTARSPMLMVVSSAGSFGVPLLSTTFTPVNGTLPQLVTVPPTSKLAVPKGSGSVGQFLVTAMQGVVHTKQVALFVARTVNSVES